ncbi:MAG TPA: hypothetical protein VFI96_01355 [Longimicrobiaceae bacterium]|nr:hypothetical protein [Longimicrobiaceae bacterium]
MTGLILAASPLRNVLFHAHSGLRFLILLAAVVDVVYFAYALGARLPVRRAARVLTAIFTGLLDLQVILGLALVATGIYYGALIGHMAMMILAVIVAHAASVMARGAEDPRRAYWIRLVGVLLPLILIIMGILAIGRAVLGMGLPSGG